MAVELFSLWGFQRGWRSMSGDGGYEVRAILDGESIWYRARTARLVDDAFYAACRRSLMCRILPWLVPPPSEGIWKARDTKCRVSDGKQRS